MIQPLPILKHGVSVAEVGNWQRFLNLVGMTDQTGQPLLVDEDFGAKTMVATQAYQNARGIALPDGGGWLDPLTRKQALTEGFIPFVQAKNAYVSFPNVKVTRRLIVIHTMENPEGPYQAENVALWFAGRANSPAPEASAHFCVDEDSVVQCVRETDGAWHAGPVNGYSIGIEHNGYANQTTMQWDDAPSRAILARSAKLAAGIAKRFGIPIEHVSGRGLATAKGFCGHVDVTNALTGGKGHQDPGQAFPWEDYLGMVTDAL